MKFQDAYIKLAKIEAAAMFESEWGLTNLDFDELVKEAENDDFEVMPDTVWNTVCEHSEGHVPEMDGWWEYREQERRYDEDYDARIKFLNSECRKEILRIAAEKGLRKPWISQGFPRFLRLNTSGNQHI